MLHTKFQDHRSGGSGEDDFNIHGHCGHLDHVIQLTFINFRFHSYEIWFRMAQQFFRQIRLVFEIRVTFGKPLILI